MPALVECVGVDTQFADHGHALRSPSAIQCIVDMMLKVLQNVILEKKLEQLKIAVCIKAKFLVDLHYEL